MTDIYAEALQLMNHNTELYMIEEMQNELEQLKQQYREELELKQQQYHKELELEQQHHRKEVQQKCEELERQHRKEVQQKCEELEQQQEENRKLQAIIEKLQQQ
jgi:hypothetical protein